MAGLDLWRDDSKVPATAFVDPAGGNRELVRTMLESALDLLLELMSSAIERPPVPGRPDGAEASLPMEGPARTQEELLSALRQLVLDSTNLAHPGFVAHMDPPPTTASVVGDLAAAWLNNNMLFEELSPALTALEERLLRHIAERFGLGPRAGGILVPGGTLANLQALVLARNAMADTGTDSRRDLTVVASSGAHSSVWKAAMVLGLGPEGVLAVPTGREGRVDASRLAEAVERAIDSGRLPFCLVATAGTTITGAIDPLPELEEIARRHRLWFHVDAAFGGALAFSTEHAHRLRGIETADSVTFNPQKWLSVARTSAMLLLRRRTDLKDLFRTAMPYAGAEKVERGEIALQGTSRTDVLKLWLSLLHLGDEGYEELIGRSLSLAQSVAGSLGETAHVELACEPTTAVVCFRAIPPSGWGGSAEEWNLRLRSELLDEHRLFVSTPRWQGARWLRLLTINPFAGADLGDRLAAAIERFNATHTTEGR